MEAASENTPAKPKRGRPRVLSKELVAAYRGLWGGFHTERNLQDKHYMTRAFALLRGEERFCWLIETVEQRGGKREVFRQGLLSELGRIENDETLRVMAEALCQVKPKTKHGIALLRRARLGREAPGGALQLAARLEETLNAFRAARPSLPDTAVTQAVSFVLEEVIELDRNPEDDYAQQ